MRKNLQKGAALAALVALVFCLLAPVVWAAEQYVYDDMGLFSKEQRDTLEIAAAAASESTKLELIIVTTEDAQGKSSMEYADDFYDYNGFGTGEDKSGALFLIDMDNREIYISTTGMAIRYLTDERIARILDNAYAYISQEDYAGTAKAFLDGVEHYVSLGIQQDQYNYDTETGEVSRYHSISPWQIVLFAVISLAAGGGACLTVKARYQMKTPQYTYPMREQSRIELTEQADRFVNQTLTSRRIVQASVSSGGGGGGGRSSTHRSSSGRSHGGGGRKF